MISLISSAFKPFVSIGNSFARPSIGGSASTRERTCSGQRLQKSSATRAPPEYPNRSTCPSFKESTRPFRSRAQSSKENGWDGGGISVAPCPLRSYVTTRRPGRTRGKRESHTALLKASDRKSV